MGRTVIYTRQSLDKEKQPYSVMVQKTDCLQFAKNHQWLVEEVYNEGKCSARKTEINQRPVLKRLIDDVEAGTIDRVIVFKRDRLARNISQYLGIIKIFRESGVELHFSAENELPLFSGITGDFIEALLAGISEYEGENIVKRLSYSKRSLAKVGKFVQGRCPYGYKVLENVGNLNLKIIKEKETIIKEVFNLCDNLEDAWFKDKDFQTLYSELKAELKKKHKFLKILTKDKIYTILRQPLYKGLMIQNFEDEKIEVEMPQYRIVDTIVWERVNAKLNLLASLPIVDDENDVEKDPSIPLLSGRIRCRDCLKKMKTSARTYACEECQLKPRIDSVNHQVCERVFNHLLNQADKNPAKLINTIRSLIIKPYSKIIKQQETEIERLKLTIQSNFEQNLREEKYASLIKEQIKLYIDLEKSLIVFIRKKNKAQKFIDEMDLKKIPETINDLTDSQLEQLLSLVKEVEYGGRKVGTVTIASVKKKGVTA